jgi:hypothetical protein
MRKPHTTKSSGDSDVESRLQELKELSARLNIEIHICDFSTPSLRDEDVPARSGACRIGNKRIILLDKRSAPGERINVILEELALHDLEPFYLAPWIRERLQGGDSETTNP